MNIVELSDDRRNMTIRSPDGKWTAHLRSARPDGFTDEHAFAALDFTFSVGAGSRRSIWRKRIAGSWYLFFGIQSGPPTWWWPRIKLGRMALVGWLRTAFEVSIKREEKSS